MWEFVINNNRKIIVNCGFHILGLHPLLKAKYEKFCLKLCRLSNIRLWWSSQFKVYLAYNFAEAVVDEWDMPKDLQLHLTQLVLQKINLKKLNITAPHTFELFFKNFKICTISPTLDLKVIEIIKWKNCIWKTFYVFCQQEWLALIPFCISVMLLR